jgi:hypothetical protein
VNVSQRVDILILTSTFADAALLSVYDKTDVLDLAIGLTSNGFRLLGSGGTAKKIREAGLSIEYVNLHSFSLSTLLKVFIQ